MNTKYIFLWLPNLSKQLVLNVCQNNLSEDSSLNSFAILHFKLPINCIFSKTLITTSYVDNYIFNKTIILELIY